jgi:hypothetical protein
MNTFWAISTGKPTGKAAGDKYSDGGGMYLLVKSYGKYWRMDCTVAIERQLLTNA